MAVEVLDENPRTSAGSMALVGVRAALEDYAQRTCYAIGSRKNGQRPWQPIARLELHLALWTRCSPSHFTHRTSEDPNPTTEPDLTPTGGDGSSSCL
jgi:hypothetical protein